MRTLYVAGPMTGIANYNYPAFDRAAELLVAHGYDVLNPTQAEKLNPTPGTPQSWQWYMRRALEMVVTADGIATLPGWRQSRGATLEVHVATRLGLPVHPLWAWERWAAAHHQHETCDDPTECGIHQATAAAQQVTA